MKKDSAAHERHLEEDEVLSSAIKTALHTFMEIANKRENPPELRIDAASRILGYAAAAVFPEGEIEEISRDDSDSNPGVGGTDE